MPMFHGGLAGLAVGECILPPAMTGARCCSDFGAEGIHSRKHVYVTPNATLAWKHAALASRSPGWVYQVVPLGVVERDPDPEYPQPGLSFRCEAAVIAAVLYQCTQADASAALRSSCSPPIRRFLESVLEG